MINLAYFMTVLLVFIRMLTFFTIVPVFFPNGTPNAMKIFIAGITAFIITPGIAAIPLESVGSNYYIILYCINEVVSGLVLGYITNICFMLIRMAGQLIDNQIGFSMMSMYDPSAQSNVTFLERLTYWISLVLFFIVDGHHILIKVMIDTFRVVKLGNSLLINDTIMQIVNVFIQYFFIGFKIAIPLILIMIITDLTMGLVSRTVPSLNIMILGMPVKIFVGLACVILALPIIMDSIIHAFNMLPNIYNGIFHTAPLLFVIGSTEEKTEDATPKKKQEARKKGQIARSKDVSLAFTLVAATLVLVSLSGFVGNILKSTMYYFLNGVFTSDITDISLKNLTLLVVLRSAAAILPVLLPIMLVGVLSNYVQTGFILTGEGIVPKLSKLNPINGFKKIFSVRTFVDLIKDIAIITVAGYIGYSYVKDNITNMFTIGSLPADKIAELFKNLVYGIFFRIALVMVIIALFDYLYQRFMFNKDLKMTKQEIKEEYKQQEGDPQVKSKIRQKQRQMSTRRMMQAVPDATVIVTNPTHIAVALKYEEGKDEAPTLVAKGSDFTAVKIKEIARDKNIPIIENKPLARMIFSEVEIDSQIPVSMYQAIAEILAIVYKMKNRKRNTLSGAGRR